MKCALLRFYGDLNDFVEAAKRQTDVEYEFVGHVAVKDAIESLGVPHPEVDLLLVNGASAPFTTRLEDGDRVSVFPRFRKMDTSSVSLVAAPQPAEFRFVLDGHLGRLAGYLRMLGFDTLLPLDSSDTLLAHLSASQSRVLLTRDVALLKRSIVRDGYYVRETAPRKQLIEVVRRFALAGLARPFRRCLRCNALLEPRQKDEVIDRVPARSRLHYDEFWACPACNRVYWKGSHYDRMKTIVDTTAEI
jgi:hypothetical protein